MTTDTLPPDGVQVAVIDAVHPSRRGIEEELAERDGVHPTPFARADSAIASGRHFDWAVIDPANLPEPLTGDPAVRAMLFIADGVTPYTVNTRGITTVPAVSKVDCDLRSLVDLVLLDLHRRLRALADTAHAAQTAVDHLSGDVPFEVALTDLLTCRQYEVLSKISNGLSNGRVATDLGLATKTVARHLTDTYHALEGIGEIGATSSNAERRKQAIAAFRRMTRSR